LHRRKKPSPWSHTHNRMQTPKIKMLLAFAIHHRQNKTPEREVYTYMLYPYSALKPFSNDINSWSSQWIDQLDLFFRQNPSFQQEPVSAWDIQSPTVGDKQRNPWQFSENNSRFSLYGAPESTKILPRVATPVPTPVVPIAPLPIPHPDYSPPLGRPVKHEPNPYDYPLRSALKKPQPYGSTMF
jgi:hypothetical protein